MLYSQDSQSMAIKLLADLSIKNYQALNDDIEIAIETFQKLRYRIADLERDGVYAIRSDFNCMNYIEALNKLRDIYEQHLTDGNQRSILLNYVINYLNKDRA